MEDRAGNLEDIAEQYIDKLLAIEKNHSKPFEGETGKFGQHKNIDEREKTDRVYKENLISSEEETYVKLKSKIIVNHAQEGLVEQD